MIWGMATGVAALQTIQDQCETDLTGIDECASNPCINNGTCGEWLLV